MLGLSIWKIAIIGGVAMVLFGRGKISETMTDVAKGIKAFKRGMKDEDDDVAIENRPTINAETETTRAG